jgi:RNA polymerase sigma-70 factor (ECF subfamily)
VAMDLCQVVFLKILEKNKERSKEQGSNNENLLHQETELNYLYTIARNKVIDYFRKKQTASLDQNEELARKIEDSGVVQPDRHAIQVSDTETLFRLLDQLPDLDREIIIMRHLQELEYSEIASIVSKEESSVRQIVSRGMKKLRDNYEKEKRE